MQGKRRKAISSGRSMKMAIKIIKNTMEEPIEKTCEFCESVFSYNYQDIKTDIRSGFFGFEYHNRFITCPVCKRRLILKDEVKKT